MMKLVDNNKNDMNTILGTDSGGDMCFSSSVFSIGGCPLYVKQHNVAGTTQKKELFPMTNKVNDITAANRQPRIAEEINNRMRK